MSGDIQINANRPVINAGQPQQAQSPAANGRGSAFSNVSSIGPANRASNERRGNRAPREFSCLGCIALIFRAIFRCLFGWCLPERQPRRRQQVDRPPEQRPVIPEQVQQAVQYQSPVQNHEQVRVQNVPQDITPDKLAVQHFLSQFPAPSGDQEENSELFVDEFKAQIPYAAREYVINSLIRTRQGEISDIKNRNRRREVDEYKGSAPKAEPLTDREAAMDLMEYPHIRERIRTLLEQFIGIYRESGE